MSKQYPLVPIRNVLHRVERFEHKDDLKTYQFAGTYSYARGIFLGERKDGTSFRLEKIQRIKSGDFVYCKIMAWEGAFGIVPPLADNAVMSGAFVAYELDKNKIDASFLDYYFKIQSVWKAIGGQSTGTNVRRRSLHPNEFEKSQIPLPPLEEQQRIVARIESLAAKIEEARGLRKKAVEEADAMIPSLLYTFRGRYSNRKKISECANMSTGTTPPSYREDYYGGNMQWYTPGDLGYQKKLKRSARTISSIAVAENKARLFEPGTILLVAIGGSLGKVGLTEEICSSNQQITGIKFSSEINPEYGWWWMRGLSKELMIAAPQATLPIINQEKIGCFEIAVPPMDEQEQIVRYFDGLQSQIDSLKRLQEETSKELDAMLPSILDKAFKGEL